jgi:hypothetical protein
MIILFLYPYASLPLPFWIILKGITSPFISKIFQHECLKNKDFKKGFFGCSGVIFQIVIF